MLRLLQGCCALLRFAHFDLVPILWSPELPTFFHPKEGAWITMAEAAAAGSICTTEPVAPGMDVLWACWRGGLAGIHATAAVMRRRGKRGSEEEKTEQAHQLYVGISTVLRENLAHNPLKVVGSAMQVVEALEILRRIGSFALLFLARSSHVFICTVISLR